VYRCDVYSDAPGFSVSRGYSGLVESLRGGMAGVEYPGCRLLSRSPGAGIPPRLPGDFQERPGLSVTVKYEYIYLHDHHDGPDLEQGGTTYFQLYNTERPHQALGYRTPEQVHFKQTTPRR